LWFSDLLFLGHRSYVHARLSLTLGGGSDESTSERPDSVTLQVSGKVRVEGGSRKEKMNLRLQTERKAKHLVVRRSFPVEIRPFVYH